MKYEDTKLDKRLKKRFQFDYARASIKKTSSLKKGTRGEESPSPEAPKAADAGKDNSGTDTAAEKA